MNADLSYPFAGDSGNRVRVLGVGFINAPALEVVHMGMSPGLVVVPSAPVLVRMFEDAAHKQALLEAGMAVIDSGFMALVWWLRTGQKLHRVSGLRYLQLLLQRSEFSIPGAVLWVMPSARSRDTNLSWLRAHGHPARECDCYVAPQYPKTGCLEDEALCMLVKQHQPRHIVLALGGGTQERLGLTLHRRFGDRLTVHCVGAAIGFLSGDQIGIPPWADRIFLGWLFRCWNNPRRFIPRYWKAIKLVPAVWRYRENAP